MSDLMPLADAADLLGVSVERVRQLVVGGQLPAQRFGNAWVVPKDAVVARRHSPGSHGRPLGPMRAWHEILDGSIDIRRPGRYQRRAHAVRCDMSRADAAALPELVGAMLGGRRAAIDLGEQLAPDDHVDLYISARSFADLDRHVAHVPNPVGQIVLRVVHEEAWELLPKAALAPRAAVALDLLESGDPRLWIAAEHLASRNG
ncbi:MAG: hypothetical protein RL238_2807 [Actinomycetota bacterium]|jgi:excisionase family DNA binding protein